MVSGFIGFKSIYPWLQMEKSALETKTEMSYIFGIFSLRLTEGTHGGLLCLMNFNCTEWSRALHCHLFACRLFELPGGELGATPSFKCYCSFFLALYFSFHSLLRYFSGYNEVSSDYWCETSKRPDTHTKYSFNISLN